MVSERLVPDQEHKITNPHTDFRENFSLLGIQKLGTDFRPPASPASCSGLISPKVVFMVGRVKWDPSLDMVEREVPYPRGDQMSRV